MNRTFSRPLFGSFVLIAIGFVLLLGNLGLVSGANPWVLLRFWPVLLIALGLDLIVRQRWPRVSNLIALATVTLAVLAVIFAPQLGLETSGASWFGSIPFIWGGEPGSGQVITETRHVSNFEAVSFSSFGEMTIQQGETESLVIEAEDNVLAEISTEVRNGRLYIGYAEEDGWVRVRPTRPILFTLTVKQLDSLTLSGAGSVAVKALTTDKLELVLSGAGNLSCEELDATDLNLRLSGAGNIDASGTVTRLDANVSGLGSLKGKDLKSETADVNVSGVGTAVVWATRQLNARVSGLGSVQYYGQPQVTQGVFGIGNIHRLGDK